MQHANEKLSTRQFYASEIPTRQDIQQRLLHMLAEQLRLPSEQLSVTDPLSQYGLDSIDAVMLAGDLEDWLKLTLPSTLLWDYPTIAEIAGYLEEALISTHRATMTPNLAPSPEQAAIAFNDASRLQGALSEPSLAALLPVGGNQA